jgi:hypothetical protein
VTTTSTSTHPSKATQDVTHARCQGKGIWHRARPRVWHLWYAYCPYEVTAHSLISHYTTLGVAELLIFHPVDTIAKRLMSNKAKVGFASFRPSPMTRIDPTRSRSPHCRPSSSASTPRHRWGASCSRSSLASGTQQVTRSRSAYTSSAGSPGSTTSSPGTTSRTSRMRSASARAR